MAKLQLENVSKSFGRVEVIKNIDLDIADGEFVVFVGPSGCGKSTLLRMIAGLEEIDSGAIRIGGDLCNDKSPKDRGIAMVFQSYALYPHKTVYQNMAFSLKLARKSKSEIDSQIQAAAKILKMEDLLDRRPYQLSGGQRQRVAIGRAIVRHPKVFLFDEPLSNLDAALRVSMRREISRLHGELKATMIYVTHDQIEAMTLADRIVVLDGGIAQQIGTPLELYHQPTNLFVAGFIGSPKMNFFSGTITQVDEGALHIETVDIGKFQLPIIDAHDGVVGDEVTVGIRPENLKTVSKEDAAFQTTVRLVERLGDETLFEVATSSGTELVVRASPVAPATKGDFLHLNFDVANVHLFDSAGHAFRRHGAH